MVVHRLAQFLFNVHHSRGVNLYFYGDCFLFILLCMGNSRRKECCEEWVRMVYNPKWEFSSYLHGQLLHKEENTTCFTGTQSSPLLRRIRGLISRINTQENI
mgnify:CR=1 FL=1